MKPDQLPLLKEVYEKGKVRKMAAGKQFPPFVKGKQNPAEDQKRQIGSDAAKRRLQQMRTQKKPEGK